MQGRLGEERAHQREAALGQLPAEALQQLAAGGLVAAIAQQPAEGPVDRRIVQPQFPVDQGRQAGRGTGAKWLIHKPMMRLGLKRVKPSPMFRPCSDIRCPDAALSLETRMFIQTEETPNPATLKFLPGRMVMERGTADFDAADKAARSPLAESLFRIDGVARIFLGSDFITVTKTDQKDWPVLKPQILGLIMEHFSSNRPVILSDDSASAAGDEDDEIVAQIKELLDTRVRPAVAQDGGDIIFHSFEDGVVYLHMQGSCSGCPSSTATLKMGIENMLRHYVPEVVEVRPV